MESCEFTLPLGMICTADLAVSMLRSQISESEVPRVRVVCELALEAFFHAHCTPGEATKSMTCRASASSETNDTVATRNLGSTAVQSMLTVIPLAWRAWQRA